MKTGKTIVELAQELTRQQNSKKDYIADTKVLNVRAVEKDIRLDGLNGNDLSMNEIAHDQVANRVGIPVKYYDRMRYEAPVLLATNINHWFHNKAEKRMVRTLDGNVRAFLSDRFRPLDNFDLAQAVLPKISEMGCRVESCEVTEKRMYIKVITERLQVEVKKGDIVQAGLVISNSEVGHGSLRVEPLIFRLVCLNGMIASDHAMRKYHVGKHAEEIENNVRFYSENTITQDNKAFFMKVRDVVNGVLTDETFSTIVRSLKDSTMIEIPGKPTKAVEDISVMFQMKDTEQESVLKYLIQGGELTKYGMVNAITRAAQDVDSYDRSTELEKIGGDVLELAPAAWNSIG